MLLTHRTNLRGNKHSRRQSESRWKWCVDVLTAVYFCHTQTLCCCWHREASLQTSHDDFSHEQSSNTEQGERDESLVRRKKKKKTSNKLASYFFKYLHETCGYYVVAYGAKLFCAFAHTWIMHRELSKRCCWCWSARVKVRRRTKVMTDVAGAELWRFMLNVHSLFLTMKSSTLLWTGLSAPGDKQAGAEDKVLTLRNYCCDCIFGRNKQRHCYRPALHFPDTLVSLSFSQ